MFDTPSLGFLAVGDDSAIVLSLLKPFQEKNDLTLNWIMTAK